MARDKDTVPDEGKVKCACPGCGIEFKVSKGFKGKDGELYCGKEHADIAAVIQGGK